mgnify:CR=1 FL=1
MMLIDYYPEIKNAHVTLVQTSFAFFALRGIAMMLGSSIGMRPIVRYTTYLIDIGLLTAAIMLLMALQLNPFTTPWVASKLILLICYIVLGSFALKRGRTRRIRIIAFVAATLTFVLMYMVARRHEAIWMW